MVTMPDHESGVPFPTVTGEYANLIEIFRRRSESIAASYVRKGSNESFGAITATKATLTDGQPLVIGTTDANKFYAERATTDLDNKAGNTLRVFGPSAGHVAIAAKDAAKRLGRVLLDATGIILKGDTTVQGGLTVTGNLVVTGGISSSSLSTVVLSTETPASNGTANFQWPTAGNGSAYTSMTWLTLQFVAPPSQTVVVSMSGAATASGTIYLAGRLEKLTGSTWGTAVDYHAIRGISWGAGTTSATPGSTTYAYSGLTAGTTYRVMLGYNNASGQSTASYLYRVCVVVQPSL